MRERLIALLIKLEWSYNNSTSQTLKQCPICKGYKDSRGIGPGHKKNCELIALKRELEYSFGEEE